MPESEKVGSIAVAQLPPHLLQILPGLLAGHPYKQIATELGLSVATVTQYARELRRLMGARTTSQAVVMAAAKPRLHPE